MEKMAKTEKAKLIVGASLLGVLAVILSVLLSANHGNVSFARMRQTTYDTLSFNPGTITHLSTKKDGGNAYSTSDDAFVVSSYSQYEALSALTGQECEEITTGFFTDYKLLTVSREGSFFSSSQIQHFKIKDGQAYVIYFVEDDSIIKGAVNKPGVFIIDFLKISKDADISVVHFTDKAF